MFGISALGWLHTLGSLPAIPVALYMFARYGRIVPRSLPGTIYLVAMLIGASSVFLVTHMPVGFVIGAVTLVVLLVGYGIAPLIGEGRISRYIETICLSLSAFLLFLPAVSETLRRVPDGHPIVTDPTAPLLLGTQAGLLGLLIAGMSAQILYLRRRTGA